MEMKKPPDNSTLTSCSNEIHKTLHLFSLLQNKDEKKYFMVGFALDFVGSSLILETNCFKLIFYRWKASFSSNIGVYQFQPSDWMIPLATRFLQNQIKRFQKNPEERRALIHLYIKASVMGLTSSKLGDRPLLNWVLLWKFGNLIIRTPLHKCYPFQQYLTVNNGFER